MKNTTMQDIANKVGVSKTTVSRALNDNKEISESMKQQILKVAHDMDYVINQNASSLKSKKSKTIGLITNTLINESGEDFYTRILKKLSLELSSRGYNLVFEIYDELVSDSIPSIANNTKVDGMILMSEFSMEFFVKYDRLNIPTVLIDYKLDSNIYTSISTNNFQSASNAVEYLIEQGHKNISFVGDKEKTRSVLERYYGYKMSLEMHNLNKFPRVYKAASDEYVNLNDEVTAYFCHTDKEAYELIQYFTGKGINVPKEVSILGFDDTFYSDFSKIKITTMKVDLDAFVHKAASHLIALINGEDALVENMTVIATVVEKDSVQNIK